MGMFDEIVCNYPIPGEKLGAVYQTKDLVCAMEEYEITAEGRLIHRQCGWEAIPENERDEEQWAVFRKVPGSLRLIDQNYHGYIEMGDFRVKFTDGVVVKIERMEE